MTFHEKKFSFIALYYLVAITVDWFREHIESWKAAGRGEELHEDKADGKTCFSGQIALGLRMKSATPLQLCMAIFRCWRKNSRNLRKATAMLDELMRANQIILTFSLSADPGMQSAAAATGA